MKYLLIGVFLLFCATSITAQNPTQLSAKNIALIKAKTKNLRLSNASSDVLNLELAGKDYSVNVKKNELLSPEFAAAYPALNTFTLYDVTSGQVIGALTMLDDYVNMMIESKDGFKIHSTESSEIGLEQMQEHIHGPLCGVNNEIIKASNIKKKDLSQRSANVIENGDFKRVYRIAIVTTGEFYTLNGNSNASVNAAVAAAVNNVQLIYDRDLAVNFQLLAPFLYTNANTDPFIPDNAGGDGRVPQAMEAVKQHFNIDQYDIGHVLHQTVSGDDWSSGGVAYLQAVCDDGFNDMVIKAGGWTSAFNTQDFSFIQIFAHELAHMFGAEHTFNGEGNSCDDAIGDNTAYEIGSGTTIMSYDGSCDPDQNIPSDEAKDDYFHAHSLVQMVNYMNDDGACAQIVQTGNTVPEVNASPCDVTYTVPLGTPFKLVGDATDADGDALTYVWEQYNEDGPQTPTQGFIGLAAGLNNRAPLFRSFPPTVDNFRYFPTQELVLSGVIDPFQVLPEVSRTLNFRLTVRDNNPDGGAMAQDEVSVQVSNSGPFEISSPNGNEVYPTGDDLAVQWDAAGSESLCDNVKIELSLDGGANYPIVISESTSYNGGSFNYSIPSGINATDQARIRITCIDNECFQFYDVSDAEFSIDSPCAGDISSVCDTDPITVDAGSADLALDLDRISGQLFETTVLAITNSTPNTDLAIYNSSSSGCTVIVDNRSSVSMIIRVSEDGEYRFDTDCDFQTSSSNYLSVFTESNFNAGNPCPSFVGSTGRASSSGGAFCNSSVTLELEKCREYRIVFWTFGLNPQNVIMEAISGPGDVYLNDVTNPDYASTYIAVESSSGVIRAYNDDSDFTALAAGEYEIYSLSYKVGGATPPVNIVLDDLIGLTIIEASVEGYCMRLSSNFKPVTIETSCLINNITLGTRGACNPMDNSYTQEISLSYELPPSSGMLEVNGQSFPITGSPQTIVLENLDSDNAAIDLVAFFSDDPFCRNELIGFIQAPPNCCPITIDLEMSIVGCNGEGVELDAGGDGVEYAWALNSNGLGEATRMITVQDPGVYSVTVTNATGCSKSQSVNVTFEDVPEIDEIDDFQFCQGLAEQVMVNSNGESIQVFNSSGVEVSDMFTFEITAEDMYSVQVSSVNGCTSSTEFTASMIDNPEIDLGDDRVACIGAQVVLEAGITGDVYEWRQSGQSMILSSTDQLIVTTPGTYDLTIVNGGLCSSTEEVMVSFEAGPNLSLPSSVEICEGDSGMLMASTNATDIKWFYEGDEIFGETGLSIEVINGGEYTAQVFGIGGCEVSQSTMVNVNELPVLELDGDQTICEGDSYQLDVDTGNSGDTYMYFQDGTPMSISSGQSSIEISDPARYEVVITSAADCVVSGSFDLIVTSKPEIQISGSSTLCIGDTGDLVATSNVTVFEWYLDGNLLTNSSANLMITEAGEYQCIAFAGSDCFESDMFTVSSIAAPTIDLGADLELCPGEMVSLDAGNHTSYEWSDGSTASTLDITAPSNATPTTEIITVIVTNPENCINTDNVTLSYLPTISGNVSLSANGVCPGAGVTIMASGGTQYEWDNSTNTLGSIAGGSAVAMPSESTIYTVSITDECPGNIDIQTIEVPVFSDDGISAGADDCVIIGEEYELQAEGGVSYLWENDTTIVSSLDIMNPLVMPSETTVYSVLITDVNGCQFEDQVEICVLESPLDLIKAVSIITPNDDGQNDFLLFKGLENYPENTLTIFNRWGNRLFQTEGYQTDDFRWDGKRQGVPLPADTYYYILNFDEYSFKSSLTIVYE